MRWIRPLGIATVATVLAAAVAHGHHSGTVRAPVLKGVQVDGRIDEWPSSLHRYSFDRSGWTADQRRQNPGQHRPGAFFMTAHDPDRAELYVAVVVADDRVVAGDRWDNTDGVEIYLSRPSHGQSAPRQYVMVPGSGGWGTPSEGHGVSWQSAATGDYSYQDGTIVYEWAFSAPQIHPRQALPLSPGEQLGFDVVLLDQSSDGRHRWIPWGTVDTIKDGGNSRVGRVTLTSTVYQASSPQAVAVDGGDLLWVLALAAVAATIVFARRHAAGVDERLTAVERRMTDTQDVLISLAEKLDRLEARESIGVEPDQEGSA